MTEKRCRHGWVDVGQCEACATEARLEEVLAKDRQKTREINTLVQENRNMANVMQAAKAIVAEQAADDGLWFEAMTAPEEHLQSELRRLHAAIEAQ